MMSNPYTGRHILVVGLGMSGFAVAKLLHAVGAFVIVNDKQQYAATDERLVTLQELGIPYVVGNHDLALLDSIDLVVKNPGIPYYTPFIQAILDRNIPIITEPEVAFSVYKGKIIALTGTNGKTTTTMLIYQMLNNFFDEVYYAGNVGIPFSDIALQASPHAYVVLELSSFQLLGMPEFKPDVAMILNLDEAHLDYHTDKSEYVQAKLNICKNIASETGCVVLNADDPVLVDEFFQRYPTCAVNYFSIHDTVNGAYLKTDNLYYHSEEICSRDAIHVPGAHNIQNILAGITAVKYFGVSNAAIVAALQSFKGVEHRMEYVMDLAQRKFYNDSKSTNVKAAQIALSAFQQPSVWITGGLDRGNDISELIPFCEHVKVIVSFGEAQAKFKVLAETMRISFASCENLAEAVLIAYDFSEPGDIILLSPACASWDQFNSFEERGRLFKVYCKQLAADMEEMKCDIY